LESGLAAAANGGFTAVAVMPSTNPPIDGKGDVEYLLNRARQSGVQIIPIGALSKGLKGESLAEMYDMFQAGARGFSDDKNSIKEAGLLHRALLYNKHIGARVMQFPYDNSLVPNGQMNEGKQSTLLGLKGIPAISEELIIQRDLSILEHTQGMLHLGPISTENAVKLIAAAKKKKQDVTCEVALANLVYTDETLHLFDSAFKVMPPLRTNRDQKMLIKGLKNGTIDVISSDHSPEDEEHKKLEFDFAEYGMASIENFFPLLWNALCEEIELSDLVEKFSINPRKVLNLPIPEIKEGALANITLFSDTETTFTGRENLKTKAYNVPDMGKELRGMVVGSLYAG
ncbi:MAG TPA: dihydroorotase, partial [Cryomorphaceae bacterium]|nr:dihydroorotase [Cryomorphaceae bacterium]